MIRRAADDLLEWIEGGEIARGAVFRGIDCWGQIEATTLSPQAVNLIVRKLRGFERVKDLRLENWSAGAL